MQNSSKCFLKILTYLFFFWDYNIITTPFPVSPSHPLMNSFSLSFKFLAFFFHYSLFNAYTYTHICCSIYSLILYKVTCLHVQVWSFGIENTSQVFSFLLFTLILFIRLRREVFPRSLWHVHWCCPRYYYYYCYYNFALRGHHIEIVSLCQPREF